MCVRACVRVRAWLRKCVGARVDLDAVLGCEAGDLQQIDANSFVELVEHLLLARVHER